MHENITNDGLFQLLGDGKSLDTMTMRCNLGGIGQGRGQSWRVVNNYGFDWPGVAQEEQQEIRDELQDAPAFAFPHGAVSAMDGAFAMGRARPGSGSFDGGRDKDADRFLSDQSKDDAQAAGSAQPSLQDTSPFVMCLGDIDQSAYRMVDVQWIAARQYRGDTWGRSDGDYLVNATPDPDSCIGQWISYDRGEQCYANWPEMVKQLEQNLDHQRKNGTDVRGLVGGTYLHWSDDFDMQQRCLNALASLDISMWQNKGSQLPETDLLNQFLILLTGFEIEPYLEINEIIKEWQDKSHLFRPVETHFYMQFLHDLSPRLMRLVSRLTPTRIIDRQQLGFSLWHEIG